MLQNGDRSTVGSSPSSPGYTCLAFKPCRQARVAEGRKGVLLHLICSLCIHIIPVCIGKLLLINLVGHVFAGADVMCLACSAGCHHYCSKTCSALIHTCSNICSSI